MFHIYFNSWFGPATYCCQIFNFYSSFCSRLFLADVTDIKGGWEFVSLLPSYGHVITAYLTPTNRSLDSADSILSICKLLMCYFRPNYSQCTRKHDSL